MESYWPIWELLRQGRWVDLTHTFHPDIPHFSQAKKMSVTDLRTHAQEGIWVQWFGFEGQWGTHVDAPAHFCQGLRTVEEIELKEMLLPLVVIDVHQKVAHDPNYVVGLNDIQQHETRFGLIPQHAFVALRTDWSRRWPSDAAMHNFNAQGQSQTPGWSLEALRFLYEQRFICASGHETIDPDPGLSAEKTRWACERYILEKNHYQIELLTHLDACPATGALVVCSFPKPQNASGFPARVFAICPKDASDSI